MGGGVVLHTEDGIHRARLSATIGRQLSFSIRTYMGGSVVSP